MFVGDENCLFRAVSLACYGSEEYHDTLRQLAATEMLQHPQWYDAERVDIFSTLSDLLCGDVSCAELAGEAELVSGSDDEKAMVGALRHVFPNAEHVFCARHLEENVRRFLTDVAGMATRDREQVLERVREATRVDADQTEQCESVLTSLLEAVRASAPSTTVPAKVLSYFEDRILPKLRNNLPVTSNSMYI